MSEKKRILIAALDWGLGHASRCVPLIRQHLDSGNEVILASNGAAAAFFKKTFPQLEVYEDLPAYDVRYSRLLPVMWSVAFQTPRILRTIRREHRWLKQMAAAYRIDEIISDNRYGLYHPELPCSIITHQVFPIVPALFRRFIHARIRHWLERFDHCLIPDFEGEPNLAGILSHGDLPANARYIGPLSRFSGNDAAPIAVDVLVLISGPEPHRSAMQEEMIHRFKGSAGRVVVLCGQPHSDTREQIGSVTLISHTSDDELAGYIRGASVIICRSGYSTVMDLHALGRTAEWVPTPGQTEQEYLAQLHAH